MRLKSLVRHMEWADRVAQEQLARMQPGTAEREQAAAIYAHVAAAEHVWLSRLRGEEPRHAVWPELAPAAAAELAAAAASELLRYVAGLSASDLDAVITYTNSAGQEFRNRVEDVIEHVALHGAYHRGQLALLARRGGTVPVATDYIAWVRGAPAPRRE